MYEIENDLLKISVNPVGCELSSVYSKNDQYEYLWQGDPAIWNGQSPILFPIVGRLIDDSYALNGKTYTLPKHGFARKNGDWLLLEHESDHISFILSENDKTLSVFPYCFDLIVSFLLEDNRLTVTHTVVNKNEETMYFSLGAHPGFNCEIGDKLVFDKAETLSTEKIDRDKSLRLPETVPVLENERDIMITKDIFNEDALILHGIQSKNITLYAHGGSHIVKFNMGNAPYLGIWAKPGAPYVCIEPWWGVNDSFEKKDDFSKKDGIISLAAQEIFHCCWSAEFSA